LEDKAALLTVTAADAPESPLSVEPFSPRVLYTQSATEIAQLPAVFAAKVKEYVTFVSPDGDSIIFKVPAPPVPEPALYSNTLIS